MNRRRGRMGAALFAALLTAWLCGCASTPAPAPVVSQGDWAGAVRQLEPWIERERAKARVAGLSIALVDDQTVVWSQGFGLADAYAATPARADTVYRMGSVSKLFTDALAMQGVSRGQLSLDAPLQAALPDFRMPNRWNADPVTLRQLMTHRAGLPRDFLGGMFSERPAPLPSILPALAEDALIAPPGRAFSYSNLGLDLVGLAAERSSGQPFEPQMQRALLQPLGMVSSSFDAWPSEAPTAARGHYLSTRFPEPAFRDVPAGGLNASVTDVARFASMILARGRTPTGAQVLPGEAVDEMLRPQFVGQGRDVGTQLGLGFFLERPGSTALPAEAGWLAHHSGAMRGFRSELAVLPQAKLAVVVASNDAVSGDLVQRVADAALGAMWQVKSGAPAKPPAPAAALPQPRAVLGEAALRDCPGEYLTPLGVLQLRREGQVLSARAQGRDFEVLPLAEGWLSLRRVLAWGWLPLPAALLPQPLRALELRCTMLDGHPALQARQPQGPTFWIGDALPAPQPLPAGLAAWAGRYEPEAGEGDIAVVRAVTVSLDQGRLWLRPELTDFLVGVTVRMPLLPVSDDEALLLSRWGDAGPLVKRLAAEDGVPRIRALGLTLKRVAAQPAQAR